MPANLRQVSAIPRLESPRPANCSERSACSIYWSGTPRRRIWLVSSPASLAASNTALPKPPIRQPSSTVTTKGCSRTAWRIARVSSGLTKRALITASSTPSSARFSAAATHSLNKRAESDQHAVGAGPDQFRFAQLDGGRFTGQRSRGAPGPRRPWDSESPWGGRGPRPRGSSVPNRAGRPAT